MPWWGWLIIVAPLFLIGVVALGSFILWLDSFAKRVDATKTDPLDIIR